MASDALTFGSLFSGIGGFDLGFERASMQCLWQVEIDGKCNAVRRKHWPAVPHHEDVKEFHAEDAIRRPCVIVGGFPCQDLSVAGLRAGLAGERSGLFHEFMRVVAEIRPGWVCIENVPGLLSSNGGRDMGTVVGTLGQLRYRWAYRVLDAQYFGLAQRRKRVFIVGSLGNGPHPAEILFDSESLSRNPPTRGEAGTRVAAATAYRTSGNSGVMPQGDRTAALNTATDPNQNIISLCLNGKNGKRFDGESETFVAHPLLSKGNCSHAEDLETHIAHQCHGSNVGPMGTLRSGKGDVSSGVPFVGFINPRQLRNSNSSNQVGIKPEAEVADAMNTDGPGAVLASGVRRLTPRECERLQGFPDDFTRWDADGKEISDSARYRMLGNAIAVPVAYWIGKRIVECLSRGSDGESA